MATRDNKRRSIEELMQPEIGGAHSGDARRSASKSLSHPRIWFQLTNVCVAGAVARFRRQVPADVAPKRQDRVAGEFLPHFVAEEADDDARINRVGALPPEKARVNYAVLRSGRDITDKGAATAALQGGRAARPG